MEDLIKTEIGRLEYQIGQKFEELKKDRVTAGEFREFSEKLDNRIIELEKKVAEANRPKFEGVNDAGLAMKAFNKLIRGASLSPEEKKVLVVGTDNAGGYIAPKEWYNELYKYLIQISPIRKYARVIQTDKRSVLVPKITSVTGASWVAENNTISTETQPVFAQTEIVAYKLVDLQKVSWELLRDAMFDVPGMLAEVFAIDLAKAEGTGFVKGTGSNQPYGITHATYGGTKILTGTAQSLNADDLINLVYGIPLEYKANAIIGMHRSIIAKVRQLKAETGTYHYVWEPDFAGGTPGTILGVPLVEMPDLDSTTGTGGENIAIYGDLKAGFWIVDNVNFEILVADQLYAANGLVGYFGIKRVGGAVVNPNAVAFLQVKASG